MKLFAIIFFAVLSTITLFLMGCNDPGLVTVQNEKNNSTNMDTSAISKNYPDVPVAFQYAYYLSDTDELKVSASVPSKHQKSNTDYDFEYYVNGKYIGEYSTTNISNIVDTSKIDSLEIRVLHIDENTNVIKKTNTYFYKIKKKSFPRYNSTFKELLNQTYNLDSVPLYTSFSYSLSEESSYKSESKSISFSFSSSSISQASDLDSRTPILIRHFLLNKDSTLLNSKKSLNVGGSYSSNSGTFNLISNDYVVSDTLIYAVFFFKDDFSMKSVKLIPVPNK